MNDIGLKAVEGVANGATSFTEPSKRNIALLMERERGVENVAQRITSLSEDAAYFGGYAENMYGPTIVRNMFVNAGGFGLTYYGIRIIGSTSVAATLTSDVFGKDITFTAGYKGSADKGDWGNNISVIFYSYGKKITKGYYVEVFYKGALVEVWEAATIAELITVINENSGYVTTDMPDGEYTIPTLVAGAGTLSASSTSKTVTGVGTTFTSYKVGNLLYETSTGVLLGTIAVINSTTSITLERNANKTVSGVAYRVFDVFSATFALTGGTYVAPVESDFYYVVTPSKKGLALIDGLDVQIVACTEFPTLTMATELRTYTTSYNTDVLAVVMLPLNPSDSTIASFSAALQTSGISNVAGYNVWGKTSDGYGNYITVPALGGILGAGFIRVPALQGDYIHIPPGGMDSYLLDYTEIYPKAISQTSLNYYTRDLTINSAQFAKGLGYFLITTRTFSTNSLHQSIHIRLQTIFYRRILIQNMGWAVQKPNTVTLKREIYVSLYNYFKNQYAIGALETSVPFETACVIICDKTNNPPSQPRGDLNADVNYIPTEATEAIKLSLNRNDGVLLVNSLS